MGTKASFWSRPRGPLLLGLAACAACCTAPLVAVVIGAGAASTLAAVAEPIAGALLGVAAILTITIYVRRKRAASAASCATDGSCGCGPSAGSKRTLYSSPEPVAEAPVACTADLNDKKSVQSGIDEYRQAFTHLISTERTSDGFRWRFRNAPGLEASLQRLSRAEHTCCAFMKFDVTATTGEIVWETRGDATAQDAIEEYMRMPDRLREESRPGHDVAHLKAGAIRVGMTFTSDTAR